MASQAPLHAPAIRNFIQVRPILRSSLPKSPGSILLPRPKASELAKSRYRARGDWNGEMKDRMGKALEVERRLGLEKELKGLREKDREEMIKKSNSSKLGEDELRKMDIERVIQVAKEEGADLEKIEKDVEKLEREAEEEEEKVAAQLEANDGTKNQTTSSSSSKSSKSTKPALAPPLIIGLPPNLRIEEYEAKPKPINPKQLEAKRRKGEDVEIPRKLPRPSRRFLNVIRRER